MMKKGFLYIGLVALSINLSSCSMLQSKSNKETASQVGTSVATQVATDLITGNKIDVTKMAMQNLPQLGGLAMEAAKNGSVQEVLKYIGMFKGMGLEQKALQYILPSIFSSGLANNSDVAGQLVGILTNSFGKKKASNLFNQAVQSIAPATTNGASSYAMDFLGQKLPVANLLKDAVVSSPKDAKEQIKEQVLSTVFAKLLNK